MKITAISDIHGSLIDNIEPCSVVCIAGDIFPLNIQKHYNNCLNWFKDEFVPWCESLPCFKVIFIAGNHDFYFEQCGDEVQEYLNKHEKIVYLEDSEYVFKGVKFYGTPWCPDLHNWAFYGTKSDLVEMYNKIPEDTDILITHCPPKIKQYGVVLQSGWNAGRDFGCQELADVVLIKKPKYHIFGHIHSGHHDSGNIGGTIFCNVSIKDEDYNERFHPFTFNYSNKTELKDLIPGDYVEYINYLKSELLKITGVTKDRIICDHKIFNNATGREIKTWNIKGHKYIKPYYKDE